MEVQVKCCWKCFLMVNPGPGFIGSPHALELLAASLPDSPLGLKQHIAEDTLTGASVQLLLEDIPASVDRLLLDLARALRASRRLCSRTRTPAPIVFLASSQRSAHDS